MDHLQTRKEQVRSTLDGFFHASVIKDGAFMAEHLHDDFVFISPKAIELRKQPFTSDFVLNPAVQLEVFAPEEQQISIVGDTALSAGIVQAKFKNGPLVKVRFSMTLVCQQTHWKLLAMQETLLP